MKDYFPLKTTQPDAIVARLNEIYDELKMMDVTYDDDVATFEFDGDVIFTGKLTADAYGGFDAADVGKALVINSSGEAVPYQVDGLTLEGIKDTDGHNRFVEGNITPNPTEGVTHKYAKWSLSGSHLMLVDAIKIDNGTELAGYSVLATLQLPSWIGHKIYPISESQSDWVMLAEVLGSKSDGTFANISQKFLFRKLDSQSFQIYMISSLTATEDLYFRFAIDLLIDND